MAKTKKNQMILKKEDSFNGETLENINYQLSSKRYKDPDGKYWREKKKERALWNKFVKQLEVKNYELTRTWDSKEIQSSHNIIDFVKRIHEQLAAGRIKLDDIGEIVSLDNGTRGSARTLHMQLWHINGESILDAADIHQYRYYYM
jgi:hypothetical protein